MEQFRQCDSGGQVKNTARLGQVLVLLFAVQGAFAPACFGKSSLQQEVDRFVDKYAQPFSLDGAPEALCADAAQAIVDNEIRKGKTRDEADAVPKRMTEILKSNSLADSYRVMYKTSSRVEQDAGAHFIVCFTKAIVLRSLPIGDEDRPWLPAYRKSPLSPFSMDGQYYRTGNNAWRVVSREDHGKAMTEYGVNEQRKVARARGLKDFPIEVAIASCDAELKQADRARLEEWEESAASVTAQAREAAQQGDTALQTTLLRKLERWKDDIAELRARGFASRKSAAEPGSIAWHSIFTIAELKKDEIPRWEKILADAAHEYRSHAPAALCVFRLRLAQLEGKPINIQPAR